MIKKTWTWLRYGNLKKETESLLIVTQNNVIKTKYVKAKIDKTQQNVNHFVIKTVNKIMIECSKLEQKEFKTRHYWVGKVIHWEVCKRLKFDH